MKVIDFSRSLIWETSPCEHSLPATYIVNTFSRSLRGKQPQNLQNLGETKLVVSYTLKIINIINIIKKIQKNDI